jgi:hypothetical protein
MKKSIFLALSIPFTAATAAQAQSGVEIGLLDCVVEGGAGFIVGSSKNVSCTYTPADRDLPAEGYAGVITKFGLDVGVTGAKLMQWLVLAPSANIYEPGALAGDYVGASAEASLAVGGGANVLVGGSERSFALQPVSVQAQTGINLALGVAQFQLRPTTN